MKALILSAGRGSRLGRLTENRPKCLLPIGSCSILEWQIDLFRRCGVNEVVVVIGFHADEVKSRLVPLSADGLEIRTIFNPFFRISDNISSAWLAREEMDQDFVLVNGDTLFEPALVTRLVNASSEKVVNGIEHKSSYDADDMKACMDGTRLLELSKSLPPDKIHGEAIGVRFFRKAGAELFADALDQAIRLPQALSRHYPSVIGDMVANGVYVEAVSIDGLDWCEVDYPADLEPAERMVAGWEKSAALSLASPAFGARSLGQR